MEQFKRRIFDNTKHVLDPTLLVDRESWHELAGKRRINGKYIFCYMLGDDRNQRKQIKEFAKKNGLKLVTLPHIVNSSAFQFKTQDWHFGDVQLYDVGIPEFLSLIQHAEIVVTDSFHAHDVFFVGRGIDYAVCLEGSLKLKEISYIHSEAYAAGELKHGTISLIEQGTLVIGVLTQSELYEKTVSNMLECKSRGAYLMGLTTYGKYEIEDQVNFTVYVPKVDEHFIGNLAVIPLQLLGYYVSVAKGLDVDKPRNLAKSVTVE